RTASATRTPRRTCGRLEQPATPWVVAATHADRTTEPTRWPRWRPSTQAGQHLLAKEADLLAQARQAIDSEVRPCTQRERVRERDEGVIKACRGIGVGQPGQPMIRS